MTPQRFAHVHGGATQSRRRPDIKKVLFACVFVAAFATFPGWAQTTKPRPVGKVDAAKYQASLVAGTRLESSWRAGASPEEMAGLIANLQTEITAVKDTERSEADRLFTRAINDAVSAYSAGLSVWSAYKDESLREGASEAATRYGVETILWTTTDKFTLIFDDGSDFVAAAAHFHAGRIGDGLGTEHTLFERIAARRSAGLKRPLTNGEAESIRSRLYSLSVDERRSGVVDALGFGKAAARFTERLKELTTDSDLVIREAAINALARIEGR